uniref:Uncharacterized protein n=1 Tax=Arundo donax TaxID=35708 RepID=A0A0A9F2G5_ARUDO
MKEKVKNALMCLHVRLFLPTSAPSFWSGYLLPRAADWRLGFPMDGGRLSAWAGRRKRHQRAVGACLQLGRDACLGLGAGRGHGWPGLRCGVRQAGAQVRRAGHAFPC